ncbi:GNAT family N-acetyltransferase [Bifidobacterium platyrrhinorum]|uniref:GNAT family N-acetyltransferase n=1 Tax=Bifidobacterium platyrrhinorum TaxID=2661628 RepID=A0A6L9ST27_9BIFI|nr:GNAT family N-acetyltransferase [Bifidobacterium platyrrhinorum]NEG55730.1 GNAT family N-acetyltransferase [Bifidobacterium platyrrhinorum]
MPYVFRAATESDLRAVTDIYNASVVEGGSTADLTPRTFEQRRAWVESHKPPYGVFVVETADGGDDEGITRGDGTSHGPVVAFGALSVFYDRAGYDGVTDLAYYIAPRWRRRGVGTFLLDHLLDEARERGMRKAIGVIFADNAGSIALMRRFGFTRFGELPDAATDSTGTMRGMSYWYLDL